MIEASVDGYTGPMSTAAAAFEGPDDDRSDTSRTGREGSTERVRDAVAELLGHDELRPGQAEAAAAVLAGRDTLAVMPTGSGKSAVYQVVAALLDGPTVVVSPLLALQKDQVEAIAGSDVGLAAAANSTVSEGARRWMFEELASGGSSSSSSRPSS
jgi:ATP-dependent DNA helicase RecQ